MRTLKRWIVTLTTGVILIFLPTSNIYADDQEILIKTQEEDILSIDNKTTNNHNENNEILLTSNAQKLNPLKPLKTTEQPVIKVKKTNSNNDLNYINEQRKNKGLSTLRYSKKLQEAALIRAKDITVSISHTRPNGKAWNSIYPNIQFGEIIAFHVDDIKTAVKMWDASPAHADLLWDRYYKTAAVARIDDYYIVEFGY